MKAYEIMCDYVEISECPTCESNDLVVITDPDRNIWAIKCNDCMNVEQLPI